jgi:hypothetical protein
MMLMKQEYDDTKLELMAGMKISNILSWKMMILMTRRQCGYKYDLFENLINEE